MRTLALDPGSHLGWCFGPTSDGLIKHGTYRLPGADVRIGYRFAAMSRFLMVTIEQNKIERVYFEEPFIEHWSPGRIPPPRSFKSELLRWGFPTVIEMITAQQNVPCTPVAVGVWRSAVGAPTRAPKEIKGNEERRLWLKKATRDRITKLGHTTSSQDEADAMGIWLGMQAKEDRLTAEPDLFASVRL